MKNRISILILFIFPALISSAQEPPGNFSIMFYNVENLFDTRDDPNTSDEAFTPSGERRWTINRLNRKLINLSKVLLTSAGYTPLQIIALCEVENSFVLEMLIQNTPLKKFNYKIIHKDSPDSRGIDVALIFNPSEFHPLAYDYIPLTGAKDSVSDSREILYVTGIVQQTDTLHIFVNHWPSRYSGLLESRPKRALAARVLKREINQLQNRWESPKIIILGDFNDQPDDESLALHLNAKPPPKSLPVFADTLYNLSFQWKKAESGTLKYRDQWFVFDQIITSGSLLLNQKSIYTQKEWATIVKLPFLLEKDERYGGEKIKRTYYGYQYTGGYSDHLPVMLRLKIEN